MVRSKAIVLNRFVLLALCGFLLSRVFLKVGKLPSNVHVNELPPAGQRPPASARARALTGSGALTKLIERHGNIRFTTKFVVVQSLILKVCCGTIPHFEQRV